MDDEVDEDDDGISTPIGLPDVSAVLSEGSAACSSKRSR